MGLWSGVCRTQFVSILTARRAWLRVGSICILAMLSLSVQGGNGIPDDAVSSDPSILDVEDINALNAAIRGLTAPTSSCDVGPPLPPIKKQTIECPSGWIARERERQKILMAKPMPRDPIWKNLSAAWQNGHGWVFGELNGRDPTTICADRLKEGQEGLEDVFTHGKGFNDYGAYGNFQTYLANHPPGPFGYDPEAMRAQSCFHNAGLTKPTLLKEGRELANFMGRTARLGQVVADDLHSYALLQHALGSAAIYPDGNVGGSIKKSIEESQFPGLKRFSKRLGACPVKRTGTALLDDMVEQTQLYVTMLNEILSEPDISHNPDTQRAARVLFEVFKINAPWFLEHVNTVEGLVGKSLLGAVSWGPIGQRELGEISQSKLRSRLEDKRGHLIKRIGTEAKALSCFKNSNTCTSQEFDAYTQIERQTPYEAPQIVDKNYRDRAAGANAILVNSIDCQDAKAQETEAWSVLAESASSFVGIGLGMGMLSIGGQVLSASQVARVATLGRAVRGVTAGIQIGFVADGFRQAYLGCQSQMGSSQRTSGNTDEACPSSYPLPIKGGEIVRDMRGCVLAAALAVEPILSSHLGRTLGMNVKLNGTVRAAEISKHTRASLAPPQPRNIADISAHDRFDYALNRVLQERKPLKEVFANSESEIDILLKANIMDDISDPGLASTWRMLGTRAAIHDVPGFVEMAEGHCLRTGLLDRGYFKVPDSKFKLYAASGSAGKPNAPVSLILNTNRMVTFEAVPRRNSALFANVIEVFEVSNLYDTSTDKSLGFIPSNSDGSVTLPVPEAGKFYGFRSLAKKGLITLTSDGRYYSGNNQDRVAIPESRIEGRGFAGAHTRGSFDHIEFLYSDKVKVTSKRPATFLLPGSSNPVKITEIKYTFGNIVDIPPKTIFESVQDFRRFQQELLKAVERAVTENGGNRDLSPGKRSIEVFVPAIDPISGNEVKIPVTIFPGQSGGQYETATWFVNLP